MKRYTSHRTNANNHKARRHYRSIMLNAGYDEHIYDREKNGLVNRYYTKDFKLPARKHGLTQNEREQMRQEDLVQGYQW